MSLIGELERLEGIGWLTGGAGLASAKAAKEVVAKKGLPSGDNQPELSEWAFSYPSHEAAKLFHSEVRSGEVEGGKPGCN